MKFIAAVILLVFSLKSDALNPSKNYAVLPSDYGLDYKEVSIAASDGIKLNAWILKATSAESKKFVVISDDGEGNMADNMETAGQFLSLGYHVLMYDYRGFGKSDSFNINTKFFIYAQFTKDLLGVLDYLRKTYSPGYCDLYGLGIGAGLSLGIGCNSNQVRRIIADGPYTSLEETRNKYKERRQQDLMMPLAYDKNLLEPVHALAEGGNQEKLLGILLIAGQNDDLFGPDDMKRLQKIHPKNLEVFIVPNSVNGKNMSTNKEEYFKQIKDFVTSR